MMEFGCGDGNQLSLADYPRYTGFDISDHAIQLYRKYKNQQTTCCFDR
ncbi:hypothetical protein EGM92_29840 [Enterobacter cloacae]|nr:hypothetical protein EGM92_29840 [Enterobacter cloacae]